MTIKTLGWLLAAMAMGATILTVSPRQVQAQAGSQDLTGVLGEIAAYGSAEVWVEFETAVSASASVEEQVQSVGQASRVAADAAAEHVNVTKRLRSVPFFKATVESAAALDALVASEGVISVFPSPDLGVGYPAQTIETGTAALDQSRAVTDAGVMHGLGILGRGVRVAVLDSGVDAAHPDLANDVVFEYCVLRTNPADCPNGNANTQSGPGAAEDTLGHGTGVAGVITSTGTVAPRGIAPAAKIEAYKVLGFDQTLDVPRYVVQLDDLIEGLDHVYVRNKVDVVNMSLGFWNANDTGWDECGDLVPMFDQLARNFANRGVTVVASSGNNYLRGTQVFPACHPLVVSVAATGPTVPTLTDFSNVAPSTTVSAPGESITTTRAGGGVVTWDGTSFASPTVAGCVALYIEHGTTERAAILDRMTDSFVYSHSSVGRVPWINCGPKAICDGWLPTVDIGSGQQPTDGRDIIWGTPQADVINGLSGDDVICGRGGNDTISGGPGHDVIHAGDGADFVRGGRGDDVIRGGNGADTVNGEAGHDRLFGNNGRDTVNGGPGNDYVAGNANPDTVTGGEGDDTVSGNSDNDIVKGGEGNDTLAGNGSGDEMFGGRGNDTMSGGDGNDFVSGEQGRDTVDGNRGNDTLWGGKDNDRLNGFTGNDRLVGGGGNDILDGGSGYDSCDGKSGFDTGISCAVRAGIERIQ